MAFVVSFTVSFKPHLHPTAGFSVYWVRSPCAVNLIYLHPGPQGPFHPQGCWECPRRAKMSEKLARLRAVE